MKKYTFILIMLVAAIGHAQEANLNKDKSSKKHEISSNLLDLIIAGTINLNYQHQMKNNQALRVGLNAFDTFAYYDAIYMDSNESFSLEASYLIYFSQRKLHHGFYFYPKLKYRTGDITTDYNESINGQDQPFTYSTNSFSAGIGVGHQWLFMNQISLGLQMDLNRNFGNLDDELTALELRPSIQLGYRF